MGVIAGRIYRDDDLLTPPEIVAYTRGAIGGDLARTICRLYGIRPSGTKRGRLFIRKWKLDVALDCPDALTKNGERKKQVQTKIGTRRGRSWIG